MRNIAPFPGRSVAMKCKDIMKTGVECASPACSIQKAAALMRELNIEPARLDDIFKDLNIPENARAENLTPKQFEQLATRL